MPVPGLTAGKVMAEALKLFTGGKKEERPKGRKHGNSVVDAEMPGKKPAADPDDDLGEQWGYHQDHGE